MGYDTSIVDRLAWRAKWRNRYRKYKNLILFLVAMAIGIPAALVFTPYGPNAVYEYIKRENPTDQPAKPWGTKWMFKLGYFYEKTMREKEAEKVYSELVFDWYGENGKAMDLEAGDLWVGYALFNYAQLRRAMRGTEAKEYFEYYMDEFATNPDSDPVYNQKAQQAISLFYRGG